MQLSWRELCRSQIIQWLKSHVFYSKEENNNYHYCQEERNGIMNTIRLFSCIVWISTRTMYFTYTSHPSTCSQTHKIKIVHVQYLQPMPAPHPHPIPPTFLQSQHLHNPSTA